MAHSADTDGYDDFGLSPLQQKAFSKSAITRQAKTAPVEEGNRSMNWGWVVRLVMGLLILGAGIYAVIYIADRRKQAQTTALEQPMDTQRVASTSSILQPSAKTAEDTLRQMTAPSADTAWSQPQASEPPATQLTETGAPATPEPKPAPTEKVVPISAPPKRPEPATTASAAPAIKYYSIVGSYSDYAHALENKQKLKMHTRILVKDGKYRLISDSVISSKSSSYLIDSLRRKRPNDWLAKAQ